MDAPRLTSELEHYLRRRLRKRTGVDGCGSGERGGVGRVELGRDGTVPSRFGCLTVWNVCNRHPGDSTGNRAGWVGCRELFRIVP